MIKIVRYPFGIRIEKLFGFDIKYGSTRMVVLTNKYAFKFPLLFLNGGRWQHYLKGLLANCQENAFSKCNWPELCPVTFYIPGGFLTVMKRAKPLPIKEYEDFNFNKWCNDREYPIPAEPKLDSFGLLNGKLVAIDYGN